MTDYKFARSVRRSAGALVTILLLFAAGVAGPGQAEAAQADADQVGAGAPKPAPADNSPAACNEPQHDTPTHRLARCYAVVHKAVSGSSLTPEASQPPPTALGPADIVAAYDLPATGTGQTVAIVDAYGYTNAESDLAAFRSHYGLPACTTANGCFRKVDQTGGTDYPPDNSQWAVETALDVDAVSSACPACHILLVEGNDNAFTSLGEAVDTAVSLGARFVSNSYGVPNGAAGEQDLNHYYDHPGVVVTASTGDAGNVASWPSTDPNVVAVGGTTLVRDQSVARGWTETAWSSGGSGCSRYEPKPVYQQDIATGCANRAEADLSADADPNTGLAVYDTDGEDGWLQVGGTSLSSPLTAAMYALAGTPMPGSYPVTYPYGASAQLNDVTGGSDGACGNVLCTAGPGWDGPTGLGTPDGVAALTAPPYGMVAGRVSDAQTGAPIGDATVSTPGGYSTTTNAAGDYDLAVPVGGYDITVSEFDYQSRTQNDLNVADGKTTTLNFRLTRRPTVPVSGTVTDGSAHGWPLYAKVSIDGDPHGPTFTDPFTGRYYINVPVGSTYQVHVSSEYPGYLPDDLTVPVQTSAVRRDASLTVDASTCSAPGYAYRYPNGVEAFNGWTGNAAQDSWSNIDNRGNGEVWRFDNPGQRIPPPGGDANFAIVDSSYYRYPNIQDTTLESPVMNLTAEPNPEIGFDTSFRGYFGAAIYVDLSLDGGATWTNVWEHLTFDMAQHVGIAIPQAAGQSNVRVRFHYTGHFSGWWAIDNLYVGSRNCAAVDGALVAGTITDTRTGAAVNGARVASVARPAESGTSEATPEDVGLPDGFYWMFSSMTGDVALIASASAHVPDSKLVHLRPATITRRNWALRPVGSATEQQ